MFNRRAASEAIWDALDDYVARPSRMDSIATARLAAMNNRSPRSEEQPRIPMTWTIDANGVVRGTSDDVRGARRLTVMVERVSGVTY